MEHLEPISTAFWSDPSALFVDVKTAFPKGKVVAITFRNQGTAVVTISDHLKLDEKEALMISCEAGYHDCTEYKIRYSATGTKDLVVMAQVKND